MAGLDVRALLGSGVARYSAPAGSDAGDIHKRTVGRSAMAENEIAGEKLKGLTVLNEAGAEALAAALAEPVTVDEIGEGVQPAEGVVAQVGHCALTPTAEVDPLLSLSQMWLPSWRAKKWSHTY